MKSTFFAPFSLLALNSAFGDALATQRGKHCRYIRTCAACSVWRQTIPFRHMMIVLDVQMLCPYVVMYITTGAFEDKFSHMAYGPHFDNTDKWYKWSWIDSSGAYSGWKNLAVNLLNCRVDLVFCPFCPMCNWELRDSRWWSSGALAALTSIRGRAWTWTTVTHRHRPSRRVTEGHGRQCTFRLRHRFQNHPRPSEHFDFWFCSWSFMILTLATNERPSQNSGLEQKDIFFSRKSSCRSEYFPRISFDNNSLPVIPAAEALSATWCHGSFNFEFWVAKQVCSGTSCNLH